MLNEKHKNKWLSLKLSLILFFMLHNIYSQQYYFKNYSAENGLPFVQIYSLFQDSKGYLWSGGYGGLSKFNGKEFKNYTPKNGLANHFVTSLIEDNHHQIIVGTIDGISVISNEKIKIFGKSNGLKNTSVTSFAKDKLGKIYIGTFGGLFQFNHDSISEIKSVISKQITCLLIGSQDCIWIGTTEGLFCLENNQLKFQDRLNYIEDKEITCLSENPKTKEIAIGTKKGIAIINLKNQHIINLNSNNGLLDEHILALQYSPEGELWIGTKSGLMNYSENGMSYYTIRDDNNSNHIRTLLFDIENNLWIGTHSGLYKYRDKGFTVYGKNEGLGGAFIYQITDDKEGNLWIGSEHNGVFKYENGIFKNFSEKDGLADNQAQSSFVSEDGKIYVGTEKGISIIENNQIYSLKQKTGIEINTPIYAVFIDKKKRLWYGTKNGLGYLQKENNTYTNTKLKLPTTISNYEVWSIKEDLNGNLWIGTYLSGLYKFLNEKITPVELPISQKIESVLDIEFDSRNNLYAATLSGVLKYEPIKNKAQLVTEQEGLSSDLVYSIKITKDYKTIWAGTNQGVSKINIEKLYSSIYDITTYNKSDGFEGVECNTHGIFEDQKGNVWFGTVNGLVKYTPQNFKHNEQFSITNFTGFKLGYQDTIAT
jgi:ligand-binding sensor domain-containing protein